MRPSSSLVAAILPLACRGAAPSLCDSPLGDPAAGGQGNVLLIVSDDIGIDKLGAYGEHPAPPPTPNLDALAAEGLLFRNAYASPSCSATRASLLTGRLPGRHGIGRWIYPDTETFDLELSEVTLPEMLDAGRLRYTSAAVGKWHLVVFSRAEAARHPLDQGFRCHAGSLANPLDATEAGHNPRSYTTWEKSVDGAVRWEHTYMTTDTTDEAVARLSTLAPPWFVYVAYNGAHDPVHAPPARLTTGRLGADATPTELYDAMVESVDAEIGRLLDAIPDEVRADTTVVYLSDNGTPGTYVTPPWDPERAKKTLYEGGVNVPLLVSGPLVAEPGSESPALVHVVDVFPTLADIAGVALDEVRGADGEPVVLDGESLLPQLADPAQPTLRSVVYTEAFYPNGHVPRWWHDRMVREPEWKLIRQEDGGTSVEQLFHLPPGASDDGDDLLAVGAPALTAEASAALGRLRGEMEAWRAELP